MNLALRIVALVWILGYLLASCGPILGGHLFVGALALAGGIPLLPALGDRDRRPRRPDLADQPEPSLTCRRGADGTNDTDPGHQAAGASGEQSGMRGPQLTARSSKAG